MKKGLKLDKIIKIVSFNIHKGAHKSGSNELLYRIREALRGVDCDLIFLQEVLGKHDCLDENDLGFEAQFEFLADEIWSHFSYAKNAIYDAGHHGNVILSKYPIKRWNRLDISTNPFEQRGVLHCVIEIPKDDPGKEAIFLHAYCVHLNLTQGGRQKQYEALIQRIKKDTTPEDLVVVAGDFNDWSKKAKNIFSSELGMFDAHTLENGHHARTFPAKFPILPLDRIYLKNIEVMSSQPLKGEPFNQLSDHLPLACEVRLHKDSPLVPDRPQEFLSEPCVNIDIGGARHLTQILNLLDQAKKSIQIHIYTLKNDKTGYAILSSLKNALARGVEVTLLVDRIGSMDLSLDFLREKEFENIQFKIFNKLLRWKRVHFGRRLHQKIILVDKTHLWIGGLNFSNEYFVDYNGKKPWLDFGCIINNINGDVLSSYMVQVYADESAVSKKYFPILNYENQDMKLALRINDWFMGIFQITKAYFRIIQHAKHSITILNSYFIPNQRLLKYIIAARKRGVKVTFILPRKSDIKTIKLIGEYFYDKLLYHGVEIYEWTPSILHGKLMLVDEESFLLGSYNLEVTSRLFNLEANIEIHNKIQAGYISHLLEDLKRDFCEQITESKNRIRKSAYRKVFIYGALALMKIILFFVYFTKVNMH